MCKPTITVTKDMRVDVQRAKVWFATTCDVCSVEVAGPNGFGTDAAGVATLLRLGVPAAPAPTDELGYCDALGLCTCGTCFVS